MGVGGLTISHVKSHLQVGSLAGVLSGSWILFFISFSYLLLTEYVFFSLLNVEADVQEHEK
jgi:hypothetical protein